jgi:hypothetical protein
MTHCPRCGKTNAAEIHSCTPKALVLADELERHLGEFETATRAAAELRRQYEEIEALQVAQYECGFGAGCCYQAAKSEADKSLLRQAADMLATLPVKHPDQIGPRDALITAIEERLGETDGLR